MDARRWREVERILDLALEHGPEAWASILDAHCGGDVELRREVAALLDRSGSARGFLEAPPAATAAAVVEDASQRAIGAGAPVGPYRLIRQIGEGGMARVFLAERADGQFEQRVAVKLLRPGHDSALDVRALRTERQVLASLDHPNIARLLDGGVTAEGQPYLAMELVEGEPIDRYCDARALPVRDRLALVLTVAGAIEHAHRNLVVHRDLKPSNILVTAAGRVLVLDFGLAKLLDLRAGNVSPVTTHTSRHWMTPLYAAPEQVRGEPATTLTDVYQLGAVLHELLTGRAPFTGRGDNRYDLARAILEDEPEPPSLHRRALRGDVDAIVLKALRKEPGQRYPSMEAFAHDVRRHLTGHPVLARRQSAAYLTRRFVRRHPLAIAAVAAVLLGVGAYTATVTAQRARVERALAQATLEAQKAARVREMLLSMFESSQGGRAFADTTSARELLRRGVANAEEIVGQPEVRAELLDLIARIYEQLGDSAQARALRELPTPDP